MKQEIDVLIIGGGVIGFSIGIALIQSKPSLKIIVVEKEAKFGAHASGRNSGVVHAGFYYSPDSLKAKFCRQGNLELKKLCKTNSIPLMESGKVVVARNSDENLRLDELYSRGIANGVDLELLNESKLKNYEPLAKTHERFLWSPTTSISDPHAILNELMNKFLKLGSKIQLSTAIELKVNNGEITLNLGSFRARYIVNAAGAQADKIAKNIGVATEFAMVPFMGIYRSTSIVNLPLRTLVYPVPHPVNPFLGVHFTLTIDNKVKIGPTAIPILGREQYTFFKGLNLNDLKESAKGVFALINGNSHDFSKIINSEWPNLIKFLLVRNSLYLVPDAIKVKRWERKPPGIRSQLVRLSDGKLEQDFIINNYLNSTHVLNAVSPGWTSALPFGRWVAEKYILPNIN